MEYQSLVRDFAQRTRSNLEFLRNLHGMQPEKPVYEVTQLINSMLGLLVFPQQRYINAVPRTPLPQLAKEGWPIPAVEGSYPQVNDLNQLVRYLRNAIAHFNLEFLSDEHGQIAGVTVWNTRNGQTNWKARLSIRELEGITTRFISMLLEEDRAAA